MRTSLRSLLCASLLLFLTGCTSIARYWYLSSYDREISSATKSIESAHDSAQRAEAYAKRGSAYSEKARYSKAFKLISADEYDGLFGLAIKDHDQAIALEPRAEAYFARGATYYSWANLKAVMDGRLVGSDADRKTWFDPAAADFRKAVEKNPQFYLAWDRLGLIDETTGQLDQAISDYTQEMGVNPLGKARLANAYCTRGGRSSSTQASSSPKANKYDAAIADYEKSIDLGATADDWSCDPYNTLLALYVDGKHYDQAWGLVDKAQKSKKWIEPEMLARLKKESGRST